MLAGRDCAHILHEVEGFAIVVVQVAEADAWEQAIADSQGALFADAAPVQHGAVFGACVSFSFSLHSLMTESLYDDDHKAFQTVTSSLLSYEGACGRPSVPD